MTLMRPKQLRSTRYRGSAEIELIIAITILITILMLVQGAMRFGAARLRQEQTVWFQAFQNVTVSTPPQYTDDPDRPLEEGFAEIRPGLPNRMHVPEGTETVPINSGSSSDPIAPFKVDTKAALGGPAWNYPAYPVGDEDAAYTREWFTNYADEVYSSALKDPLGLKDPWTP